MTSGPGRSFLIALAVAAGAPSAWGEEPEVGELRVEGNERTRAPVILGAAGIKSGDRFGPQTAAEVKQRVLNLRLFRAVVVVPEPRGSAVDLSIHVVERRTLLPVPFVGASSRGVRGGLYLLESNLFGWNKLLALGGTYSAEGLSGFALYRDPGVGGSRALLRGSLRYGDLLREQFDGEERVYAYRDERFEGSLAGGYQVLPWLATYLGWYGALAGAGPEGDEMPPPGAGPLHGWTGDVEVRAQDFHLYFNEGLLARLSYRHALAALGADRDVLELGGFAQLAWRLAGDQSTSVTAQGALSEGDAVLDVLLLGGVPGTRGFERLGLWAERAATVTIEHQMPLLRFDWGIWTVNGFAEAGAAGWRGGRESFVTPGAGFRLYLLGVAFPAVGVDVAWSIEDQRPLGMASVGFGQ
jgi:Surface antigen variable number repeat